MRTSSFSPGPSLIDMIHHYTDVLAALGPEQGDWMRGVLVSGMDHCAGRVGPDQADSRQNAAALGSRDNANVEL